MNKKVARLNKPKPPSKADYVRGDMEVINQKLKAIEEYRTKAFNILEKDFGTDNAEELVMLLAEKYHPPIQQYHQQGRKLKWTAEIDRMLAVFLDSRYEDSTKTLLYDEIEWLLSLKLWNDFLEKTNQREISNPAETIRKHREYGLKNPEYQAEMSLFKEDQKAWVAKMVKVLQG